MSNGFNGSTFGAEGRFWRDAAQLPIARKLIVLARTRETTSTVDIVNHQLTHFYRTQPDWDDEHTEDAAMDDPEEQGHVFQDDVDFE